MRLKVFSLKIIMYLRCLCVLLMILVPQLLIGAEPKLSTEVRVVLTDFDGIGIGNYGDPMEVIQLVNSLLQLDDVEQITSSLGSDDFLSGAIVPVVLPVLFPEDLQDASQLSVPCEFAHVVEGKFRWKDYYRSTIVFDDFPFYVYGNLANAHDWDYGSALQWAVKNGILRKELISPPDDLVHSTDRLISSETLRASFETYSFPHPLAYSITIIRRQAVNSLMELPGTASALRQDLGDDSWQRFKEVSFATRQFIVWDSNKSQYVFDR